jgi:hypothetical protein
MVTVERTETTMPTRLHAGFGRHLLARMEVVRCLEVRMKFIGNIYISSA